MTVHNSSEHQIWFGGDYNPEQWPKETWLEDVRLMREAGVNTATVGVFSWALLEPEEGRYDFRWLDEVFDLLSSHGIGIVLATPTASPPPWFSVAYPEALPLTADGIRVMHGSRDAYNAAHPAYRTAAVAIARALAERYGRHPALKAWHIHNEYGTVSFGPHTDAAFRLWLQERYGTLDRLNAAWWTAFWSQSYSDWDQIIAPQRTQYLSNPTQVLDFKRFSADLLLRSYEEQAAVVRAMSPGVPVTTNFILASWLNYDQWAFADASDVVAIDHYIDAHGVAGAAHAAFGADLARSFARNRPWLLMEQAANTTVRQGRTLAKKPGELFMTSMQHVSRGAFGILFFQWRAGYGGAEAFHAAMLPHAGADTRGFREVKELGHALAALPALDGADRAVAGVKAAIAWDADGWWATESHQLPTNDFSLHVPARALHEHLWRSGVGADFVRLDDDLSAYRLLLIPSQLLAADRQVENVRAWVAAGGVVAVWYLSGTFDENLHVIPGGYSGAFSSLLGIRVTELQPLEEGARIELSNGMVGTEWSEDIELHGARAVATYRDDEADGRPAITSRTLGDGQAWYVSTHLSESGLRELIARLLAESGLAPAVPGAGDGVEAVRRSTSDGELLFLLNHTAEARLVDTGGIDAITGRIHHAPIELEPRSVIVLREAQVSDIA